MSNINLENPGNRYEGRIERLQIQRSDGTIRESKIVNIHNTIVDTGLDNLLTVGGFDAGTDYNSKTLSISNFNTLRYDVGSTIRMLWYMAIGTDSSNNATTYDMTDLVTPYVNASGEKYSQSHYIPTSTDLSIRGTTDDSMVAGDIHSTHRITSNSIKASEDGVEITEVAFFVGVNSTYNSDIDFNSQVYTPGDMFSRISLGDAHKVTLNTGERLVVTYALTEYAGASTHQAVTNLNLVDADGNPIQYKDSDGNWHTYGAISRCFMCDGKRSNAGTGNYPLPGAFHGIHQTSPYPCTVCSSASVEYAGNYIYTPSIYAVNNTHFMSDQYNGLNRYHCWGTSEYGKCFYFSPVMVSRQASIYRSTASASGVQCANQKDTYGFPSINQYTCHTGGMLIYSNVTYNGSQYVCGAGRCNNNNTNPTPTGWYNRISQGCSSTYPVIDTYYRCSTGNNKPATRSETFTIPTYHPIYCAGSALSPSASVSIWWLFVRGMIYKIGYYPEGKEGNLDEFVQAPITKKAGQIMRIKFSETVSRHVGV